MAYLQCTIVTGSACVLQVRASGSLTNPTVFSVDGNQGRLLEVTDDLSCSVFSANTIAGLPVVEAFSNYCTVLGQYGGHQLQVTCTSIRGGKCNTASGTYSFIGGGCCNNITNNCATTSTNFICFQKNLGTIGGGYNNTIIHCIASTVSAYSCAFGNNTIAGGSSNTAGCTISGNYTPSGFSTVGGGFCNTASGYNSTVGGGGCNSATAWQSTISGGYYNTACGCRGVVVGGVYNIASGIYSSLVGGQQNCTTGAYSFLGAGSSNRATAYMSTISGGYANCATANYAVVVGGNTNRATAACSAILGGSGNTASAAWAGAFGCNLAANVACTFFVNNLCACGTISGVSSCTVSFTSVSSVTATHNFGTKNVHVSVYDDNDYLFSPSSIRTTTTNTVDVVFTTTRTGRIVITR